MNLIEYLKNINFSEKYPVFHLKTGKEIKCSNSEPSEILFTVNGFIEVVKSKIETHLIELDSIAHIEFGHIFEKLNDEDLGY